MKAAEFDYVRPSTLDEALAAMAGHEGDARLLAGGQSLMPMMNFRLAQPDLVVDLNAIAALRSIEDRGDSVVIGAMTTYAALERSVLVADHLPLVAKALPHIAHPAIRNRGTIGGSLCLADPAAEMPALMLALEATVIVTSASGERRISADDFLVGLYETDLAADEIVTAVSIPKRHTDARFAFGEVARRHGDYAMAGVAVATLGRETVEAIRIACFSVGDRAMRAGASETAMIGHSIADPAAVDRALDGLDALTLQGDLNASVDMKRHLARVLLRRALRELD